MILSTTTNKNLKQFIGTEFEMLNVNGPALVALTPDKKRGFRTSPIKSIHADKDTVTFETENSTYIFHLEKGERFSDKYVARD